MRKVGNVVGHLAQFLLLLKVGTTHEVAHF